MKTREEIGKFLLAQELEPFKGMEVKEIISFMFKRTQGLRLTRGGDKILSRYLPNYRFPHHYHFKAKHLIQITRQFTSPYYIGLRVVTLYSDEDAMMVKLCGGLTEFLDNLSS